ncbi:hypothetical protein KEM56_006794 [Ascosphaera pollenicola]|nr:hypothetical protein KEM56_006794 [Ascosphaera pollenicola]
MEDSTLDTIPEDGPPANGVGNPNPQKNISRGTKGEGGYQPPAQKETNRRKRGHGLRRPRRGGRGGGTGRVLPPSKTRLEAQRASSEKSGEEEKIIHLPSFFTGEHSRKGERQ